MKKSATTTAKNPTIVKTLFWTNANVCLERVPLNLVDGINLAVYAVSGGRNPPIIISQPFRASDGWIKYFRFDSEKNEWDLANPRIAGKTCDGNWVTLSAC